MRMWYATVRGFGHVSGFYILAETAWQAERKALLSCNVSVEVREKDGIVGDDFDLPRKLVEAHAQGLHDELSREGCSECQPFS